MPAIATIDLKPRSATLTKSPDGQVLEGNYKLSLMNVSGKQFSARVDIRPDGNTQAEWIQVDRTTLLFEFAKDRVVDIPIKIKVPAATSEGTFGFTAIVVDTALPDERFAKLTGSFDVPKAALPPPPPPQPPRWLIPVVVGAVVLLGGGAFAIYKSMDHKPIPPVPLQPDAAREPARKELGLPCAGNGECASSHCVGGVCCDQACTGACESCVLPDKAGKCSAKARGTTCGSPAACGAPNTFTPAQACDGASHVCPAATAQDCGDYQCTNTGCRTTCADDSHCVQTRFCANQRCSPKLENGVACQSARECLSGVCNTYYSDGDGDGFGVSPRAFCGASPPANYAIRTGDCCDQDANVYPDQPKFFTAASRCGNFDYNCRGGAEKESTTTAYCVDPGGHDGWSGTVPECGVAGVWRYEVRPHVCYSRDKTQACR
jgi:hypothetical protein